MLKKTKKMYCAILHCVSIKTVEIQIRLLKISSTKKITSENAAFETRIKNFSCQGKLMSTLRIFILLMIISTRDRVYF